MNRTKGHLFSSQTSTLNKRIIIPTPTKPTKKAVGEAKKEKEKPVIF
jgi:hypothetical protein